MTPEEELIKVCKDLKLNINNLTKNKWYHISTYQYLSEAFIVAYKDVLISSCISRWQKLSEQFIEEHKEWLSNWHISECQTLSEPFIIKHKDWLSLKHIERYQFISDTLMNSVEFKINQYNDKIFII